MKNWFFPSSETHAFRIFSIAHILEYELLRSFKIQGSDFGKIPVLQFRCVYTFQTIELFLVILPRIRLELTHLTAPEPKSGVSTNFTTWALRKAILAGNLLMGQYFYSGE